MKQVHLGGDIYEQRLKFNEAIVEMKQALMPLLNSMNSKTRSLDDLVTGIEQLLSKSRCSFSDEEKVLLNDCISVLQDVKRQASASNSQVNLELLIGVVKILMKLFTDVNLFDDFS